MASFRDLLDLEQLKDTFKNVLTGAQNPAVQGIAPAVQQVGGGIEDIMREFSGGGQSQAQSQGPTETKRVTVRKPDGTESVTESEKVSPPPEVAGALKPPATGGQDLSGQQQRNALPPELLAAIVPGPAGAIGQGLQGIASQLRGQTPAAPPRNFIQEKLIERALPLSPAEELKIATLLNTIGNQATDRNIKLWKQAEDEVKTKSGAGGFIPLSEDQQEEFFPAILARYNELQQQFGGQPGIPTGVDNPIDEDVVGNPAGVDF